MSHRRKDIFKLLYDLVNRGDTSLKEVFAFVEEILCKDPSLIQSYSLCAQDNQFQDTLILWLINRLVGCLGEREHSESIHLANVKLQRKILTSCLTNRACLFETLVGVYIAAVTELCNGLLPATEDGSTHIDVHAFSVRDAECLRDIDAAFDCKVIQVQLEYADERVQALLNVLEHAFTIGYDVYPTLFHESLPCALLAFKECVLCTKLTCLRYCNSVLQTALLAGNGKWEPVVESFFIVLLNALALLWSQLPLWQLAGILRAADAKRLVDISIDVLATERSYVQRQSVHPRHDCSGPMWEYAFAMLEHAARLASIAAQPDLTAALVNALVDYALALNWHLQHDLTAHDATSTATLMRLCTRYPRIVRLLAAAAVVPARPPTAHQIHDFLVTQLCTLLAERGLASAALLAEIIIAFMHIHHTTITTTTTTTTQPLTLPQSFVVDDAAIATRVEQSVHAFLAHAEEHAASSSSSSTLCTHAYLRIAGQLLQCTTLRNVMATSLQQRLLTLLDKALQRGLSAVSVLCGELALTVAPIVLLPYDFKVHELQQQHRNIITHITGYVCRAPRHITHQQHDTHTALRTLYCRRLGGLLAGGQLTAEQLVHECAANSTAICGNHHLLASLLRRVYCVRDARVYVRAPYSAATDDDDDDDRYVIVCAKCSVDSAKWCSTVPSQRRDYYEYVKAVTTAARCAPQQLPPPLKATLCRALLTDAQYHFVAAHLEQTDIAAGDVIAEFNTLAMDAIDGRALRTIMPKISVHSDDAPSLRQFGVTLYARIIDSLQQCTAAADDDADAAAATAAAAAEQQRQTQQQLLHIIDCVACETLDEHWLFHYFKLTFFYMVHPASRVVHESVLTATQLCQRAGVQPIQLWHWYKRDALALIVQLCVLVYLQRGVRLIRSLRAFTMLLGYSCVQEFVCKYYRLLITMLLPYCVKDARCKGLLVGIAKITRKPIAQLLEASFLRIYAHICLNETPDVANRCIELIVQCTDCSLNKLMHADVRQTVAELLIYYNRNAEFVLRAFQCLLLHETNASASVGSRGSAGSNAIPPLTTTTTTTTTTAAGAAVSKVPSNEFAKFIADRMLGVITYFETCLAEPNYEKSLKQEALESLGQIIRCVGPQHVTQFRFKIIAMLSFVLSLQERQLQPICLKIWHTFLHIVDLHELGTSLGRIVASLAPLLPLYGSEVNDIYDFIIVKNASMLGAHIPDLYFVEDMQLVRPATRQCVARQTALLLRSERTSLLDKLAFYQRQISNEHPPVCIHGLRHLRQFIVAHRVQLHQLVLQQITVDPLFENLLVALLHGCRHEDDQLQLAAAKCLGELGAIDPTYLLKQNSSSSSAAAEALQGQNLPLGVITDEFAIMALMELCRAYHHQKDTKYVDNFSLAMQETLAVCGVSPREHKKLNVWAALPERMQQVMLPLLSSCYTSSRRETRCAEQPIFGSAPYKRYDDWSFVWASRLIGCVRGEETQQLLNAYKPSMKRDASTLSFFMPYVLLHALQEGSDEQVAHMVAECQAVFDYSNGNVHSSSGSSSSSANNAAASAADENAELLNGAKEFPTHHVHVDVQCTQDAPRSSNVTAADAPAKNTHAIGEVQLLEQNVRLCTKLCSELIDFLARWQREWQQQNNGALVAQALSAKTTTTTADQTASSSRRSSSGSTNAALYGYRRVEHFLGHMDKLKIAHANFCTGEFARALLYLEEYITDGGDDGSGSAVERLQTHIPFLIKIYGQLNEADAVEGAAHVKQTSLDLPLEMLVNRILDRPQDLMACYEQLLTTIGGVQGAGGTGGGGGGGETLTASVVQGMIDCYLRLEAPETASLLLSGLWQACEDAYCDDLLKECNTEILWRLGRYDELQELIAQPAMQCQQHSSWSVQRAHAFLHFRRPPPPPDEASQCEQFVAVLDGIRGHVLAGMRTSAAGCVTAPTAVYAHTYGEVIKLQLLNDMEACRQLVCSMQLHLQRNDDAGVCCLSEVQRYFADWQTQLRILQPLARIMEPVLCFRRRLLTEMAGCLRATCAQRPGFAALQQLMQQQESELWICSAQINRAAGLIQQAQLSLMQCQRHPPPTLALEQAQLLWRKGEQSATFKLLNAQLECLETRCGRNVREYPAMERALYARAKYLQATYNAEAANICTELNLRQFREAIAGNRQSERCHVQLALYMERIYDSLTAAQKCDEHGRQLILEVMVNYAKSLRYGSENVYQSLPRLLGYWLDLSSQQQQQQQQQKCDAAHTSSSAATLAGTSAGASVAAAHSEYVRKMNDLIANCANLLPTALFYTAFSQLLSRICHPSMEVYNVLRVIVVKLVEHYPQQSLWMLLPLLKSSYANRIKRCQLILRAPSLSNATFTKLLADFNTLAERLIELTNKEVAAVDGNYQLSQLVPSLPKLFNDAQFSSILLPFEKYMQATFPVATSGVSLQWPTVTTTPDDATAAATSSSGKLCVPTNPFPYKQLYITGIDETVCVLRSAARPKKISFRCSDGQCYAVMVKPKDDLRRDYRLMEFNGLVKRYLHQDSDARQRRLRIRTYAAIPFNEECGLVEWLPHLNSFRSICTAIYRSRGQGMSDRQLRQYALPCTDALEKKVRVFRDTLRPRHPPVFHVWLRQRFPSPHSWYEARTAYVRTIAVMSMVGYILGLGDRHGENVLFDELNGDAVHVDFNCLFNQGELFAYPELVPFRLTHNMTFAMGPLGVEGVFRKSCELTLRLLKQEAQTLISVLRPFVYDLVVLTRKNNIVKKSANGAELTDPKALQHVQRIEERLKGYVTRTTANSMPLSVEGQVNYLIEEATDINNLAAMYIGWGSYI